MATCALTKYKLETLSMLTVSAVLSKAVYITQCKLSFGLLIKCLKPKGSQDKLRHCKGQPAPQS